jgi:hypothetical protein
MKTKKIKNLATRLSNSKAMSRNRPTPTNRPSSTAQLILGLKNPSTLYVLKGSYMGVEERVMRGYNTKSVKWKSR